MNAWTLRAATSADLPHLAPLLPSWELERASFVDDDPDSQLLLAFLASAQDQRPLACLHLRRNIGLSQPRYWYHLGSVVHAAAELGMFRRERTLLLGNDLTGCAELADFSIDTERATAAQQRELPGIMVRAALLLLYRDWQLADTGGPPPKVIAAVPGYLDTHGDSPFWQGLGRHFFPGDVRQAQDRFGNLWLTHVAALLPRHPLVVSILHESAQAAIGTVDAAFGPWCEALRRAGLREGQHLNLYDAGPIYEAPIDLLPCSGAVGRYQLDNANAAEDENITPVLLAGDSGARVQVVMAAFRQDGGLSLSLDQGLASGLGELGRVWAMSADAVG